MPVIEERIFHVFQKGVHPVLVKLTKVIEY